MHALKKGAGKSLVEMCAVEVAPDTSGVTCSGGNVAICAEDLMRSAGGPMGGWVVSACLPPFLPCMFL